MMLDLTLNSPPQDCAGGMTLNPDGTISYRMPGEGGGCFIAGTLVHTKEGLVPIEKIKVGDYVLSKPEDGTGELAYKRVLNTFKHEDKKVMLVEFVQMEVWKNDVCKSGIPYSAVPYEHKQFLVTTPNHPFWVKGVGWTAAGALSPHDSNAVTLEMSSGAPILLTEAGPLYQTPLAPGKVWFMDPEMHELGVVPVDYGYGEVQADTEGYEPSPDINMGGWSSETGEDEGILRQTVYNIEVEDWHTYYVGKFGVWVHNANCVEVTSSAQVKAVYDKLDAEGKKALPSEADLNALKPPHTGLTFAEQGMYLGNNPTTFQQATNGAKWIQEGSSRVTFAEPVLRIDAAKFNAEFGTKVQQNYVQGDALTRMPGQVDGYSKTIVEASSRDSNFMERDPVTGFDKVDETKLLDYLKAKSFALRENPGFSWVLEIEGRAGYEMVRDYIAKNVAGQSWFSKDFYLAHAEPLVNGALERQLPDNLTGFAKGVYAAGNEVWGAVGVNKLDVLRSLDDGSLAQQAACFVPGTTVWLTTESRTEIQFVEVGQEVLSRCEATGEMRCCKVTNAFMREDVPICYVYFTDEDRNKHTSCTTAEHPFWVRGQGWTKVGNLKPGQLLELKSGKTATITEVKVAGWKTTVYNIEVEGFHTYFVEDAGVWVHNKNGAERTLPATQPDATYVKNDNVPKLDGTWGQAQIDSWKGELQMAEAIAQTGPRVEFLVNDSTYNKVGVLSGKNPDMSLGSGLAS